MTETNHITRAPEGSIDALAKALGLIADPSSEIREEGEARPWITSENAGLSSGAGLKLEAMEARLSSLEKGLTLVQTQLGRAEDWQTRMEKSFALVQETLRGEFQTASRIVLGAAAGLAVMIFIGHWL